MAEVQLIHLTKRFGRKVTAVDNLNLTIHDKEFLVLLGPSGCGKTTTMRMIAGLEEVTEGHIIIDGEDVTDLPPRKRRVSMVFQNYAVWPHMTVYDNIAYPFKLKKIPKNEIEHIVHNVATLVNIGELLNRYPGQLSGGQQQRVALARAIAVKPKVFLMDEPLSNLDAKLRVAMRTELKAIHTETQATTVFVTHDQSEAMSMADRIVVMHNGRIEQIGTPEEVYEKSANMLVAAFIGMPPTNFFNVEISQTDGNIHLISPHFNLKLNNELALKLKNYNKRQLVVGVRPENILLTTEKDKLFSTEVRVVEPQGSHQIIAFLLNGKTVKLLAPAYPKISPGEQIHLKFDMRTIRFFDPDTTLAVDN
ncbi:ABC transporter ATP-binding protein [Candidatus Parcubacteria bacterium]|nr:MAG: ABC transporter ATP-binding protein [Candidatus Parcubacteria bacterium]